VIGQRARRVSRERALDYVLGLTIVNDVSVRDLQSATCSTAAPRASTRSADRAAHRRRARPGKAGAQDQGQRRDQAGLLDLRHDLRRATLIAFVSAHMTLEPGDVIATGTPSGVGNLTPGDVVAIEIEGIGVLENP